MGYDNRKYTKIDNRGRRITPSSKLHGNRITPQKQAVEINIVSAKMELNINGNVSRVIKPYNIGGLINEITTEYGKQTGRAMKSKNLAQLNKLLKAGEGFIGAHYEHLYDWAFDNLEIVAPILGVRPEDAHDDVMGIGCGDECATISLGDCGGVCVGSLCETVAGVTNQLTGETIIPSSKTYGFEVRITL